MLALAAMPASADEDADAGPFGDVEAGRWSAQAIETVAITNRWLPPSGERFRPRARLSRGAFARALVRAFAPEEPLDDTLAFPDLTTEESTYRFANVAVKLGWLPPRSDGSFDAAGFVAKRVMDRALVMVSGGKDAARALNRIHTEDETRLRVPRMFGWMVLADQLNLHFNHPTGDEIYELYPWTKVKREDAAYAIARTAAVAGSWQVWSMAKYTDITLPDLSEVKRAAVEWAFSFAGMPYVYAGEWHRPTPNAYCCGTQARGGFDCSGFTWWVLAAPTSGWDNTMLRPYEGWSLPQRSSADMAAATGRERPLENLVPLDLAFFDTDGSGSGADAVDHVGVSLGNGWMIHSSGSRGGVTIDYIADGWWAGAYVFGRRIVPKTA